MEFQPVEMVSYPSEENPMEFPSEVCFNAADKFKHWSFQLKNSLFLGKR